MKTRNHENYHICPICGHEYNFWDHGHKCPNCRKTAKSPLAFAFAIVFALCALPFALSSQPATNNQQQIKYLVTINTGHTTAVFKNVNTATADSLLLSATGINSGTSGFLKNSKFFEIRTGQTWFYCEAKNKKKKKKYRHATTKKQFPDPTNIFNVTGRNNIFNVTGRNNIFPDTCSHQQKQR